MSQLVSNVEFKKSDGKPITFNFQFENGLPMKPLLEIIPEYRINLEENYVKLLYYLDKKESLFFSFSDVENLSFHESREDVDNYELWIHFEAGYLKTSGLEGGRISEMKSKEIHVGIYNFNREPLCEVIIS